MTLSRITLTSFRNHAETTLERPSKLNLLIGANGAGKTNILEALSLLAPGRGLRRAALPDMTQHAADSEASTHFAIGVTLNAEGEPLRLGTYTAAGSPNAGQSSSRAKHRPNMRRKVRINSAETSAIALGEWLAISWLTPAMDGLFTGSAQDRRRYMDRLALALDPQHASHASRYEAALRERNRLLADDRPPEPAWLDGIEAQMAQHGAMLAAGRANLVDRMMAEVVKSPEAPFPRPALSYVSATSSSGESIASFEQLSQALHDGRSGDRAARRTLTGPHRDELEVLYAAKRVPAAQCSTGEQKALLIAMTLAHSALAQQGRTAILLLDEVAAHLDPQRRIALFDRLRAGNAQVWMTGTEAAPFAAIAEEAAVWEIADGSARSLNEASPSPHQPLDHQQAEEPRSQPLS